MDVSKRRILGFYGVVLAALCTLGLATHSTNLALDDRVIDQSEPWRVGALPDGKALRVLSIGFDRLVADLYWIRTVNYIGHEEVAKVGYPFLYDLGDLVTDIDPFFKVVYTALNSVLTVSTYDPDSAIKLLDKGIEHNDWWKLHFLQGFNYFFERGDYVKAAHHMRRAAELPGGPAYLALLAARLEASSGSPETALAFVQARMSAAQTDHDREALAGRMRDLWVHRDLKRINEAVAGFQSKHGVSPGDISSLIESGLLQEEPRDPRNQPYRLVNGRAVCDSPYDELNVHVFK